MSKAFEFYKGRIESCPSYGFKSGLEILDITIKCAGRDSTLTKDEFNSIMKLVDVTYTKMMEENYNEGWS